MTDKPEGPGEEGAARRTREPFGPIAFHGLPTFVVLERALAAIEQDAPRLAMDAVEALREGLTTWPDRDRDLGEDEAAAFEAQFDAMLDQVERLAGPLDRGEA